MQWEEIAKHERKHLKLIKSWTCPCSQFYGRYRLSTLKIQTCIEAFPGSFAFRSGWVEILDVNSCSNLAFTEQEQCQAWPSEPRWQLKPAGKTGSHKEAFILSTHFFLALFYLFFPVPYWSLLWPYFRIFHLEVIRISKYSFSVLTGPYHLSVDSQWVSVSKSRDSRSVIMTVCLLYQKGGSNKMLTKKPLKEDAAH